MFTPLRTREVHGYRGRVAGSGGNECNGLVVQPVAVKTSKTAVQDRSTILNE